MDTYNSIITRRSIRSYKPDPVERELIEKVLDAGLLAASAKGTQSGIVITVTNKEVRDKISKLNAEIMGVTSDPFYGAPVIIIVLEPKSVACPFQDGSLMLGDMMQAAHALGLGSCWINRAIQEFERQEGKEILQRIGIEGEYIGIGHLALGYPAEENPAPAPRLPNRKFYIE